MKIIVVSAFIGLLFMSCNSKVKTSQSQSKKEVKMELTNKEKAIAIIEAFETGNSKVLEHIGNEYIQHNLDFPDGKEILKGFFTDKPTGIEVQIHRVIEEENMVALHSTYGGVWNNGKPQVAFDVFRFEDGVIVEHWDNLLDIAPKNASDRTQTDGITEIKDLDKTNKNKEVVTKLMNEVFLGENFSLTPQFISSTQYLQHNPQATDGLEGLNQFVKYLTENNIKMKYINVHQIIAEGDFVLTLADGTFGGQEVAYYDLFRLEDGLIVEHWDVVDNIPAISEWKNKNGKFKKK
jgi:predicted SnoaL-like aldol condensation-catalyzing enzyme